MKKTAPAAACNDETEPGAISPHGNVQRPAMDNDNSSQSSIVYGADEKAVQMFLAQQYVKMMETSPLEFQKLFSNP